MEQAHIATAKARNLPVSWKQSVEIATFIRGKNVQTVKKLLEDVLKKKVAVPSPRFHHDKGHKRGMAAGRYPQKSTKEILKLIKSAESNAQNKGLNTNSLIILSVMANRGPTQWHYGRQSRTQAKRCHIDITLAEKEPAKKEAKETKK